ncbi:MAG: molybdenum cofactor biosynthesis protein [Chloroflexi bacterium HGW-Chloroflexi-8]|nr:MAG: molybdenum cofactor biosynthesis protein [Chloroflexi bacterium HGW-Chloroflexi-8]
MINLTASILTISDRSYAGTRPDSAGPKIIELLKTKNIAIINYAIVPDEIDLITKKLSEWINEGSSRIIFTTGGTGFAPRDNTPEATKLVIEKETPGISEYIRKKSAEITPHAILSRGISGISKTTLIINLPGSPKAACESIEFIINVLPHAVELIMEDSNSEKNH